MKPDSTQTRGLLEQVREGDRGALDRLLTRHRPQVQAFVDFHLDSRLRTRADPSDVVQETQMEVMRRMDDFLRRRPMPFHLWVRRTAYERLLKIRRDHRQRGRRVAVSTNACVIGKTWICSWGTLATAWR